MRSCKKHRVGKVRFFVYLNNIQDHQILELFNFLILFRRDGDHANQIAHAQLTSNVRCCRDWDTDCNCIGKPLRCIWGCYHFFLYFSTLLYVD